MKRINPKNLLVTLALICSITLSSCGFGLNSDNNNSSVVNNMSTKNDSTNAQDFGGNTAAEKVVAYMNATYTEDTFEYLKPLTGATKGAILMKSQKFPNEEVWGVYDANNSEQPFQDNYVFIKYKEQSMQMIESSLKELLGESNFVYKDNSSVYDDKSKLRNLSFEEFISNDESRIGFSVVVDTSFLIEDKTVFEQKVAEAFDGVSCTSSSRIWFSCDQSLFEQLRNNDISWGEYYGTLDATGRHDINLDMYLYTSRENTYEWRKI